MPHRRQRVRRPRLPALQVLTNPVEPLRVYVDRHHFGQVRFSFRDESGFPAGRRTGIEYPLTRGEP